MANDANPPSNPLPPPDAGRSIWQALGLICKDATLLMVAKAAGAKLRWLQRVGLKAHLMGCSNCKRFGQHMAWLDAACERMQQAGVDLPVDQSTLSSLDAEHAQRLVAKAWRRHQMDDGKAGS